MMKYYILNANGEIRGTNDLMKWAKWFESSGVRRRVANTQIKHIVVSTVFLGLDHSFGVGDVPILFETMIFGSSLKAFSGYQERYATKKEAEAGHKKAVEFVKSKIK